jgi:hypothetical protein
MGSLRELNFVSGTKFFVECCYITRYQYSNTTRLLSLETNGLSGTIASELQALSNLRYLMLEDGVMSGSIPKELGQLSSLEVLDLNFNLLVGSIPDAIYKLKKLRQLDLNDNLLDGKISSSIGQLQSLTSLQLQNNRLTGTVPSSLGTISSLGKCTVVPAASIHIFTKNYAVDLTLLYLSLHYKGNVTLEENSLQGTMPQSVCQLKSKSLTTLTSDCLKLSGRSSPPFIECACCTRCF